MISIIVPVYNVEKYLDECIQSIVSQSYTDWECILIDDGSTDKSGDICDQWTKQDQRIKVIHQKNQGVSIARNQGIDKAKGEYITFIDSDDWVDSEYLQTLFQPTLKQPTDLVVAGLVHNYNNGSTKTYSSCFTGNFELNFHQADYFIELNKCNLLYPPYIKLYKTELIKKHKIKFNHEYSYGEDLLFNYQYLEHVNTIACINQAHYHYRILGIGTLSSTIRHNQFEIDYEQWKVLQSFYQQKGLWNQDAKNYLYNRLWGIIYDGIFLYPKLKGVGIKYIRNILSIPEIKQLKQYKELYPCSSWIKRCILKRQSLLFYLFIKLKK